LPQREKKETKYAIYNFYIQRIPPYSASWTENPKLSKMRKWVCGMSVLIWLKILRNFRQWRILENDAIWNFYSCFFHSKEMMHEIQVWRKKSRTKRFGNSPRPRTRNYNYTTKQPPYAKEKQGQWERLFLPPKVVNRRILVTCLHASHRGTLKREVFLNQEIPDSNPSWRYFFSFYFFVFSLFFFFLHSNVLLYYMHCETLYYHTWKCKQIMHQWR
jgi:hypothetical protein